MCLFPLSFDVRYFSKCIISVTMWDEYTYSELEMCILETKMLTFGPNSFWFKTLFLSFFFIKTSSGNSHSTTYRPYFPNRVYTVLHQRI